MTDESLVCSLRGYADVTDYANAAHLMRKAADEIERQQRWIFMLENSTSSEVITLQSERDEARDFARFLWSGYYDGQGIDYENLEDIKTRLPWLGQGGSAVKGD